MANWTVFTPMLSMLSSKWLENMTKSCHSIGNIVVIYICMYWFLCIQVATKGRNEILPLESFLWHSCCFRPGFSGFAYFGLYLCAGLPLCILPWGFQSVSIFDISSRGLLKIWLTQRHSLCATSVRTMVLLVLCHMPLFKTTFGQKIAILLLKSKNLSIFWILNATRQ